MSAAFIQVLRKGTRKRVALVELRRCWLDINPDQLQHPQRDNLLLTALMELANEGELLLPARASFEAFGNPAMPKFVTLIDRREAPQEEDWASIHWVPELGFWTELGAEELRTAKVINDWLRQRRGQFLMVPLRERSLELFGDEKYLDRRHQNNSLFSGRLSLKEIGAISIPLPLTYRDVDAPGQPLLVVENHHTYWSFAEWNARTMRFAAVVYGSGKAFCSSGEALAEVKRECSASHALYFGDLDPAGINIPLRFNLSSTCQVEPAVPLYRLLLACGVSRSDVLRASGDDGWSKQWLPELSTELISMWESGKWMPQEGLGTEQLFDRTDRLSGQPFPRPIF